jgi:hypothetical protein
LLGVNLNIRHQIQEAVQYLLGSLALGRIHPLEKSIEEGIIVEDARFRRLLALLGHDADPSMSLNRHAGQPSQLVMSSTRTALGPTRRFAGFS